MHVSSSPDPVAGMLACSDNMFVHNNSKHGRKSRKVESAYSESLLITLILQSKLFFQSLSPLVPDKTYVSLNLLLIVRAYFQFGFGNIIEATRTITTSPGWDVSPAPCHTPASNYYHIALLGNSLLGDIQSGGTV